MGAANAILVLAYALNSPATFTLLGILLFTVGFNFGYGSLVWVYASESFPVRLRTQGGSAMLTADLFANFIVLAPAIQGATYISRALCGR